MVIRVGKGFLRAQQRQEDPEEEDIGSDVKTRNEIPDANHECEGEK